MFAQVITNLMSNALNYTPAAASSRSALGCAPSIGKNGLPSPYKTPGRESLKWIDRTSSTGSIEEAGRKSDAPSTGLGVAICKRIVEKLDGRLTLESEPGKGAAFTVWLRPAPI
jgi:signal transduction histidine kinase